MLKNLKQNIENDFLIKLNKNQWRIIERLIFEIIRREKTDYSKILSSLKKELNISKYSPQDKFSALKRKLLKYRFPLTTSQQSIDFKTVYLNEIKQPLKDNWKIAKKFKPLTIITEEKATASSLFKRLREKFPDCENKIVAHYRDYLKDSCFTFSQIKKPLIFITNEPADFIKPCPCTKHHLGCGYWIFNLGFGCPFDCSYCFLQQYTNFFGVILPANIDSFLDQFSKFIIKFKKPIRIGTGEFSDSLALDDLTEYSKKIIPYFQKKNVLFELKTKSTNINNILSIPPGKNIIISWSLNPSKIIEYQEFGATSLVERLNAAKKVQDVGYKLAFHFDPIIHLANWEKLYTEVIDYLYSQLQAPFAWISLGTLRSNRKLKTIVELRFPESNIFYGELLLGKDKKLRYPEFIRSKIYNTIIKRIKLYDKNTPIYLCMESEQLWKSVAGLVPYNDIENSLINFNFKN